jgi:hypothetical protein
MRSAAGSMLTIKVSFGYWLFSVNLKSVYFLVLVNNQCLVIHRSGAGSVSIIGLRVSQIAYIAFYIFPEPDPIRHYPSIVNFNFVL